MRVVSCHRIASPAGYSSISAIVQFDNDGGMGHDVKRNVRLKFDFLREPNNTSARSSRSQRPRLHRSSSACDGSDERDDDGDVDRAVADRSSANDVIDRRVANGGGKKRRRIVDDGVDGHGDDGVVVLGENEKFGDRGGIGPDDGEDGGGGTIMATSSASPPPLTATTTTTRGTTITYKIDYSCDYGEMKPLLGIHVYALGDHPSIAPPAPIIDDDAEDDGEEEREDEDECDVIDGRDSDVGTNGRVGQDGIVSQNRPGGMRGNESEGVELCEYDGGCLDYEDVDVDGDDDGTEEGDKFRAFVNPENVVGFLDRANINLDERSVFYFLLTFPFYEHEWDLAGFLFSALFDDDDDDDEEDDDGDDDEMEEGEDGDEEYPDDEEDGGSSALDRYKKFLIGGYGKNYCSPCI
jgi:hypothetical protein